MTLQTLNLIILQAGSQDPAYRSTNALWPGHPPYCERVEEHPVRPLWRELVACWDQTNLPCPERLHVQALLQSAADWGRDSYGSLARAEACGGEITSDLRGQIRRLIDQIAEIIPAAPYPHRLWVDPAPLRLIKVQLCSAPEPHAPPVAGVSRSQPTWLGCWFTGTDLPDIERRAVSAGNTLPLQWREAHGWRSELRVDLWITVRAICQVGNRRPRVDSDHSRSISVQSLHLTSGAIQFGTVVFWQLEPVGQIRDLAWIEVEAAGLGHGQGVPLRLAVTD